MFIPGMITLILRGPLNPKTLVSWMGEKSRSGLVKANQTRLAGHFKSVFQRSALTHIANGCQLLTQVVSFQAAGAFQRVEAAVVHRELGSHEVGPASRTQRVRAMLSSHTDHQTVEYDIILLRSSRQSDGWTSWEGGLLTSLHAALSLCAAAAAAPEASSLSSSVFACLFCLGLEYILICWALHCVLY